jgi:hypothetical protein
LHGRLGGPQSQSGRGGDVSLIFNIHNVEEHFE